MEIFQRWVSWKFGPIFCCSKAVAFPNKKYNNNNNKMEILTIPIMNPLAGVHDI